ncbi:ATP-binding protein [Vibrio sonorensis]|uniref:ATP-binding protein n=1 Tax=Vibrio sonorensis TaxID=1004316 RepID=UPI0008DA01BD|nr:ATP-binding protein [Vibrio sonorensis]
MIRTIFILLFAVLVPFIAIFAPYDFSPLQYMNERVSHQFFKGVYQPTMEQFQNDLAPITHEERLEYLADLAPHFEHPLKIIPIDSYKDDASIHETLLSGEIALDFGDPIALMQRIGNSDDALYFALYSSVRADELRQIKGPVYLGVREIRKLPQEQWADQVAAISEKGTFTLAMVTSDELPNLEEAITAGDDIYSLETEEGEIQVFAKLDDNHWMVVTDTSSYRANITLLSYVMGLFILLIAFTHLFWFYPLWRGLKQLTKTANQFGHGLLTERAKVSKRSIVAQLANSFNQMADNIEKLIAGHRELTNAIAHDLRTPLYRLRFAFEMLNSNEISNEQKEKYSNIIDTSIDDLDNLINQTLQLSRYSRVADINQFSKENLAAQIHTEIEHYQLEHPDLEARFICHPQLQEQELFIDGKSMLRALKNLLSNAARFTQSQVVVSFDRQGSQYVLRVEDDGPGIPDELKERIFEPFAQIDNQERQTNKGHGLGLAIVKQIAIWHKGYAQVTESAYQGAAFEIRWPVYRHANPDEGEAEKVIS